jgi:hypothetical protein
MRLWHGARAASLLVSPPYSFQLLIGVTPLFVRTAQLGSTATPYGVTTNRRLSEDCHAERSRRAQNDIVEGGVFNTQNDIG